MPDVILDPFHRQLAAAINEKLAEQVDSLSRGSASRITEDVVSVAEKYAAKVAYIQALRDVLELAQELENAQHATPRNAKVSVTQR